MDLGVHLPLVRFGDEQLSLRRLATAVDCAGECGFAGVSANDHLVFRAPWLDGPTALASIVERSGRLTLATTMSLAVVRGPVPLAKALAALDVLSEGRLVAALGPGSSKGDYNAVGISFEERWKRFDEVLAVVRGLLTGEPLPKDPRYYPLPAGFELAPAPHQGREMPLVGCELGLQGRAGSGGERRRRLARVRLQHDAGAVLRCPRGAGALAPRARQGRGRLSVGARDHVDLGLGCSGSERTGAHRRPGAVPEPSCGRASRTGLRRNPSSTARSSSRATHEPGAGACICGRWAMSAGSSSGSPARWLRSSDAAESAEAARSGGGVGWHEHTGTSTTAASGSSGPGYNATC